MQLSKPQPGHILLVDDIIDNLHMLTDMLENLGHNVQIALNGASALEAVATNKPDLILLDIQMPGMNGYEVCERIKENKETADIPIIFLSALSDTADIIKGFDVGGVDYVNKPFKYKEVVARVQSQLAVSQQRREIEALREHDKQQFESLAKFKNKFMAGTAHDLKNPLAAMVMYIQKLRHTPPENQQELEEIADVLKQTSDKMLGLISDILDLAQMQVGHRMSRIELSLNQIIENALQTAATFAREKDIELRSDLPDDPLKYEVNSSYFERMLDNLISNAIKYTPEQGTVHVTLASDDESVILRVADNGLGIPAADIPHIFEAFYRVKSPAHKAINGTGLGLSIVAAIVEEHDGTIELQSEEGVGTTFIITLPNKS